MSVWNQSLSLSLCSCQFLPVGLEIIPLLPSVKTDHFSKPAVLQRYSNCADVWQDNGSRLRQKLLPSEVGRFLSSLSLSVSVFYWSLTSVNPPGGQHQGVTEVYGLITSHMQHVRRRGFLGLCGNVSFEFLVYSSMKWSKRPWKDCDCMFLEGFFRSDVSVITVSEMLKRWSVHAAQSTVSELNVHERDDGETEMCPV